MSQSVLNHSGYLVKPTCPATMRPNWNNYAVRQRCCASNSSNAAASHGSARSARDVHQLEARIDSLASRNSKLMETLKEARQQLLALREEVDRLGQPPSGYGVLLFAHDDETVDVFTSGRKMRLTCSPNIESTPCARARRFGSTKP